MKPINNPQENAPERSASPLQAARSTVDNLRSSMAKLVALTDPKDIEQAEQEFKDDFEAFGAVYPLLKHADSEAAEQGLDEMIASIRSPETPVTLQTLRDGQYNPSAMHYVDLLRKAGNSEDDQFAFSAHAALGGWRRRHEEDTETVVTDLQGLAAHMEQYPSERSTTQYEIAQGLKKLGNIDDASYWMEESGRSAEAGGDLRKGRMSRAEAIKWVAEANPTPELLEKIAAIRSEFTEIAESGDTSESRDEAARWVLNSHTWNCQTAMVMRDPQALREHLSIIDQDEYVQRGWITPERLEELRTALKEL